MVPDISLAVAERKTFNERKNIMDPDPRTNLKRRICKDYNKDHITRITCNQQTLYQYDLAH